jgi:intein-encoded DNA endonuclease-like protein
MKETLKDQMIRLYSEGYAPIEITKMLNAKRDSVYTVLSRHRRNVKLLIAQVEHKDCEENVVLQTINSIFNTNPIIKNPNRMAAY